MWYMYYVFKTFIPRDFHLYFDPVIQCVMYDSAIVTIVLKNEWLFMKIDDVIFLFQFFNGNNKCVLLFSLSTPIIVLIKALEGSVNKSQQSR